MKKRSLEELPVGQFIAVWRGPLDGQIFSMTVRRWLWNANGMLASLQRYDFTSGLYEDLTQEQEDLVRAETTIYIK
jgi:hypothetical protein